MEISQLLYPERSRSGVLSGFPGEKTPSQCAIRHNSCSRPWPPISSPTPPPRRSPSSAAPTSASPASSTPSSAKRPPKSPPPPAAPAPSTSSPSPTKASAGRPKLVFADLPGYGYAKISKSISADLAGIHRSLPRRARTTQALHLPDRLQHSRPGKRPAAHRLAPPPRAATSP